MMGRGIGGRGKSQNEYSPKLEDRDRRSGWGVAPPSRHLWVGSLSTRVTENALSEQFLRFGDLDNISYLPGRNYAFVNYKKVEDAIIAMRALQGFNLAGMPLKIEFAKGDKPSTLSRDEEHLPDNDASLRLAHGDSPSLRDLRPQRPSPEKPNDKSKANRSTEPSEMLWIGFPSFMNVDEAALRRAFSPFGEIDTISTFPGRTFAFVRFKTILAACRAKEALQGKLFNSPRVSICFARGENSAEQGRGPHALSSYLPVHGETFQRERSFESSYEGEFHIASPALLSKLDRISGDPNIMGFGRNSSVRVPEPNFGGPHFEHGRLLDLGSERRIEDHSFEHHRESPAVDRPAPWLDFSFEKPRRPRPFEGSWGSEDDQFSMAKKLKADSFADNELPEYNPFTDLEKGKLNPVKPKLFSSLPDQLKYNKIFDSVPFGLKGAPDPARNIARPLNESNDLWGNFDGPSTAPSSSLQKFSLDHQPPLNKEWKWEGTIAKGGTAVCRARCFPVGKVLDFMLPEFLDCTARTDLDMLAKHYYQAANSWVVFFVPETDADIGFYNEFMHFLGEKQRSAVAKLGEKVSLFLVPPSDFSQQVLKVPGKVSISGVILKFRQPSSGFSSLNNQLEAMESKPASSIPRPNDESFYEDGSFPKLNSPDFRPYFQGQSFFGSTSVHAASASAPSSFPPADKPANNNVLPRDNLPNFHKENIHEQFQHPNPPLPPSNFPNSSSRDFRPAPNAIFRSFDHSMAEEFPPINPKIAHGTTSSTYTPEASGIASLPASKIHLQQQPQATPQATSSMQLPLHPDQLAHLAALLGQQKQSINPSSQLQDSTQPNLPQNPSSQTQTSFPYAQALPNAPYGSVGPQVSQAQQQQQQQVPRASTIQQPIESPGQQAANNNREETEADPQKRLQATLQLAAALLQQIQQQAKP